MRMNQSVIRFPARRALSRNALMHRHHVVDPLGQFVERIV